MDNEKKIKGYKGFNPDMTCRDFQYEVGKEYETDKAKACKAGFHFCENPLEVWEYYPPCNEKGQLNRFCEVEAGGEIDESGKDKIACTKIKIDAEIGITGIIKASIKYILNSVKKINVTTGNYAHSVTTGDYAHSVTTGDYAHSATTGNCAHSVTTGKESIAAALGRGSIAKGALGCWIVITEYDKFKIKCVKAFEVDGKKIKADTFYKLENGKAVEVKE